MAQQATQLSFEASRACRMAGITERQLRRWQKQGLVPEAEFFGFSDLLALKTIAKLSAARFRAPGIRRAVDAVRERLRDVADPLLALQVYAEGRKLSVRVDGQPMEAISGQLLLDFDRDELDKLRSFPEEGVRKTERNAEVARRSQSQEWFERGVKLERAGATLKEIVAAYKTALEFDENSVVSHVNLGTAYFHAGQLEKAEQQYLAALKKSPDYSLAWFNLGNIYDEQGEWSRAAAQYLKAIEFQPDYADAHYNLALSLQNSGQVLGAVRHWRIYLKLDPSSAWAAIAKRELAKLSHEALLPGARRAADGPQGR